MRSVLKSAVVVGIGFILTLVGYVMLHSLSTVIPARNQAAQANLGFAILCLGGVIGAVGVVVTVRSALKKSI